MSSESTVVTPSQEEQARLAASLDLLNRQGYLEYTGEYGAEVTTFIPFVAWLHRQGYLRGRRILTYMGMRPHYFFLEDDQFSAKRVPRKWLPDIERYWPYNSTYTAVRSPWHVYPNYRAHYIKRGHQFKRPVLFIQNKFNVEWDIGPINFMPLKSLKALLSRTVEHFDVVYSRPRVGVSGNVQRGYVADHNAFCDYPDRALLEKFPQVLDFEAWCESTDVLYNQAKLETLAKARVFVAVQGGGAHVLSCFGNSLMLLLHHREGLAEEYPHAYQHGPYKYLAPHPPKLMVARSHEEFHEGVLAIREARIEGRHVSLPDEVMPVVERLSL